LVKEDSPRNKIVVWTSSFHPVIGGVQTAAKEIGIYFHKKNWDVSFITNRYPRILDKKDVIKKMAIYRFTFLHSPFNYLRSFRLDLMFAWIFYKPFTLIKLIFLIRKIKPNIVHIHYPDAQIFEIFVLKKIFEFDLIISCHGNDIIQLESISKNNFKYKIFQKLLDKTFLITACSDFLKNKILKISSKSNHNKIQTMYNGVSDSFLNKHLKREKDHYIFSIGRFVHKKGFDILNEVSRNIPEIEFQLGGGSKDEFLQSFPGNSMKFNFLGQLTYIESFKKYSKAKITIVPSREEPFGIVIAEALCCGSPIVATNVGGIPEVITLAKTSLTKNEKSIFNQWVKLVEPDYKSLIIGINEILKNSDSIELYLQIVPKIQKQFTWNNQLKKYYKSLTYHISN